MTTTGTAPPARKRIAASSWANSSRFERYHHNEFSLTLFVTGSYGGHSSVCYGKVAGQVANAHRTWCSQELEECRAFELLKGQGDRVNYLVTKHAKIVAMTCTHAALKRREFLDLGFKYDNLLMEESAQILEIETFIPMLLQKAQDGHNRLKRVRSHTFSFVSFALRAMLFYFCSIFPACDARDGYRSTRLWY